MMELKEIKKQITFIGFGVGFTAGTFLMLIVAWIVGAS